jgi:hypothetical protein
MAHDSEREPKSYEPTEERAIDGGKLFLNRRSYMKLSAAAAATVGTAAAAGTAMAATTRHGISFDRVVNAVDDLGWDPNGNRAIDVPTTDDTLIEVPPGTYVFAGSGGSDGPVQDSLTNWGIRGLGDDPGDVVFRTSNGKSTRFVNSYSSSNGVLLENVTFDNTDAKRGGDIGNVIRARDNLEVHDVDHVGFSGKEPYCRWSLLPTITTSGGVGNVVNYRKTGPSWFAGHGSSDGGGGVFQNHQGRLNFRGCVIENQGGDGGLYTGKHPGKIVFEDCRFANNDMAVIRTGAGSELRNCEIVMDWDNAHPDNVLDSNDTPTGAAGTYFSSAQFGKSGGGIYDCDFRILSTYGTGIAGIAINPSDGNLEIHNTSVHVDVDDLPPVLFMDPRDQRFGSHQTPDRPWSADIRNLTVTGSGDCRGGAAITLEGRHGSTISGSCIQMPNGDGIAIDGANGCTVENTNINVGGRATVFRNSNVSTSDIARTNSCPLPDQSAGGRTGGSDDGSDDSTDDGSSDGGSSDGGSDDTEPDPESSDGGSEDTASGERIIDIQGDGEFASYEFTVDGSVDFNEAPEDTIEGSRVSGAVAGTGTDSYRYTGTVTEFRFKKNDATIRLDGETVSPSELVGSEASGSDGSDDSTGDSGGSGDTTDPEPESDDGSSGGSSGPYRLTVRGTGSYARYAVSVSGGLKSLEPGEETPNGASSLVGHIAGTATDPYEVTGSVTDFTFRQGDAKLFLDGEPVTPDELVRRTSTDADDGSEDTTDPEPESDDDGSSDGGSTGDDESDAEEPDAGELTDVLTVVGETTEAVATYRFTVDGSVESNPEKGTFDDADNVSGGNAEGTVAGGVDSYRFSGEFTDFELSGPATVYLNGEAVDPQSLVDADGLPAKTLTVVGTTEAVATYRFTTDGSVVANPTKGTVDDADNIADRAVEGTVASGGVDSYRFSGSVTEFDLQGDAAVYVDGTQVSPDLLGTDADARLRNLVVVDGTGADGRCAYEFSIDGAVEKSPELGSIDAGDSVDAGTVSGSVEGERDAYRFTGDLTGFDMDGSATLRFQTS